MLQIPDIEKKDLSSLMNVFYGGEGMTEEAENSVNLLLKKCGCNFALKKGLGMTEVTSAATVTFDNVNDFESVGVPLPKMNCKIVQPDTFDEVTYGEQGEVCFYGPTLMLGYYEHKQETDDLLRVHPDGKRWLHTGDLGYINEDGVLFITGRIKRIIMTKGLDGQVTKMFPDRIEKALYAHQAVELCCVIGVPDEDRINYPKAFVVLKADYAESESLTQEIISVCQENLPGYMVPNEIEYHSSLPRTERGKIDYRALEEMAQKA
jgi:long-chain acyl-CoA synthetase